MCEEVRGSWIFTLHNARDGDSVWIVLSLSLSHPIHFTVFGDVLFLT